MGAAKAEPDGYSHRRGCLRASPTTVLCGIPCQVPDELARTWPELTPRLRLDGAPLRRRWKSLGASLSMLFDLGGLGSDLPRFVAVDLGGLGSDLPRLVTDSGGFFLLCRQCVCFG